ncbi:hypothetical protein [uncultured Draconibacterium sp.]|uniref:hypothetical protein n=1 Tax=uncultured Draconibacterium sp. TaxID=1573823 RepID=UPI002AA79EEA|nr:hypothetical protein [uncultured Draconibacterium sp.]
MIHRCTHHRSGMWTERVLKNDDVTLHYEVLSCFWFLTIMQIMENTPDYQYVFEQGNHHLPPEEIGSTPPDRRRNLAGS